MAKGERHGRGTFVNHLGVMFFGEFVEGYQHGRGEPRRVPVPRAGCPDGGTNALQPACQALRSVGPQPPAVRETPPLGSLKGAHALRSTVKGVHIQYGRVQSPEPLGSENGPLSVLDFVADGVAVAVALQVCTRSSTSVFTTACGSTG